MKRQLLKKKEEQLSQYGRRLDKIKEEHEAYYMSVIIPAYESIQKREQALAEREKAYAEREAVWTTTVAEYQSWIERANSHIQHLQQQIESLEKKKTQLNRHPFLLPPPPAAASLPKKLPYDLKSPPGAKQYRQRLNKKAKK